MTQAVTFASSTQRFSLPNLFPGQAQKEFFVNEGLALIDALLQLRVAGLADAPPPQPAEGECWIVSTDPQGEWQGHGDAIACFAAGGWTMIGAERGMRVFDLSDSCLRLYADHWQLAPTPALPQGGTTMDSEARIAIADLVQTLRIAGILPAS